MEKSFDQFQLNKSLMSLNVSLKILFTIFPLVFLEFVISSKMGTVSIGVDESYRFVVMILVITETYVLQKLVGKYPRLVNLYVPMHILFLSFIVLIPPFHRDTFELTP